MPFPEGGNGVSSLRNTKEIRILVQDKVKPLKSNFLTSKLERDVM